MGRSFFISLFILSFAYITNAQTKNIVYKKHTDSQNGVSINYPENWIKKEIKESAFFFMRPREEAGQKFMENVNLIIDPPDDLSLKEYAISAKIKMEDQMVDFKEVKSEYITMNGREYFKLIYTFTFNKLKMHDAYYITMDKGQAYNLICSATESTFGRFYPVFETMAKSFKIIK